MDARKQRFSAGDSRTSSQSVSTPAKRVQQPVVAVASDENSGGKPVVGTCSEMCSASERAMREREKDISIFEVDASVANQRPRRTSSALAG
jgi:hypothetical protein